MRKSVHRTILVFSLTVAAAQARGQYVPDGGGNPSTSPDTVRGQNGANIVFDRNLNTFNWLARARLDTTVSTTHLLLNESYSSDIIQIEGASSSPQRRQQSNQQNASLQLSQPLIDPLRALFQWSSLVFSDDRSIGLNNASNHALLGGFEYTPLPSVSLTPLAGYRWDNQQSFHDRGVSFNVGGMVHDLDLDGYRTGAEVQFAEDRLDPRRLDNHFARGVMEKSFSQWTRDSLAIGIGQTRRDFYSPADSSIESRVEHTFSLGNLLQYTLDDHIAIELFTGMNTLGLEKDLRPFSSYSPTIPQFNTHVDEVHLDAYIQTTYHSDDRRTSAWVRFLHSERNETHVALPIADAPPNIGVLFDTRNTQEHTKDNFSRRTALAGTFDIPLSRSDRLSFSGMVSILRYDTPSLLNVEDRDEQLIALNLSTSHRVSRFFDLGLTVDGTINHTVYLLGERSANNNINRVLHLSPHGLYRIDAMVQLIQYLRSAGKLHGV